MNASSRIRATATETTATAPFFGFVFQTAKTTTMTEPQVVSRMFATG
jgi:hypothetical protein